MSTHTIIRPEYQAVPTPSAPGFKKEPICCGVCLRSFTVWRWEDVEVTIEHVGNGSNHVERHGPRKERDLYPDGRCYGMSHGADCDCI